MFLLPPLTDLLHSLLWLVMQGVVYCNHFHNGLSFPWVHSQRLQHAGDYFHGNLILINGLSAQFVCMHTQLPLSLLLQQYFTQFLLVSALEHLYKMYVCDVTDVIMGLWKVMSLFFFIKCGYIYEHNLPMSFRED